MSKVIKETTSLLDSAMGPVAVTTTEFEKYDVDDFVQATVKSKAQYLRIVSKAKEINPLEVENRPPVDIANVKLGGYHGV